MTNIYDPLEALQPISSKKQLERLYKKFKESAKVIILLSHRSSFSLFLLMLMTCVFLLEIRENEFSV